MKTIIYKSILLAFVAFGVLFASYGQQYSDSLKQYLEIAAKNNPNVMQRFSEYQAALQKVPQVGSLPDPDLNIGIYLSPMELMSGELVADIRLMQMFPWFGVIKNAKDEMSLMAKAKYELFRDAKLQVFYEVQRTWYDLYKNQQNIRISEKSIDVLRTLERLTLVKFKTVSGENGNSFTSGGNLSGNNSPNIVSPSSGMSSMGGMGGNNAVNNTVQSSAMQSSMGGTSGGVGLADLYRIQMDIGELDNNISLLKSKQNTIIVRFNSYLNRSVKTEIMLPDTLKPDSLDISYLGTLDSVLVGNNPMLSMLEYEKQSFEARKKMVTRMGYPMVGIGLNYSLIKKSDMSNSSMNGKDMIMPMVTITLPIYRKKYRAMQAEADLLKSSTEYGYKALSNSLQTEYYEVLQLLQDAQRRMNLYAHQSLLAKKSLDIMVKGFSVSSTALSDILLIRQQTFNYELKQVEAVVDYNVAVAWLKRLIANTEIKNSFADSIIL